MPMAVSSSVTYCADGPARIITVICGNTMVIFQCSQSSLIMVRDRIMLVAANIDSNTS